VRDKKQELCQADVHARIVQCNPLSSFSVLPNGPTTHHQTADTLMDALLQDLRYALRSHARSLGVFTLAVVSLALGVAANTTIFSAVDVFLIRPLPYPTPESLVRIWSTNAERGWTDASSSLADYLDWRAASRPLPHAAVPE
jgi:hypothetical protein